MSNQGQVAEKPLWKVVLADNEGEVMDVTEVDCHTEAEAIELGDEIFKESNDDWENGFPEGYVVSACPQD